MLCHEDASTTILVGALATHAGDLVRCIHLVVLEHMKLDLLLLVFDLLGFGVCLLLALLATTAQAKYKMQGGFLLDIVVLECAAILELLASEDEALLVRWDPLLVLPMGLDGVDGVSALDLQGDGLAS